MNDETAYIHVVYVLMNWHMNSIQIDISRTKYYTVCN